MREKLKNDLLMILDQYVQVDTLRRLELCIETILSNYEVEKRKTEIIPYGSDIPETVQTYIVTKKIEGLSEKSLYLYLMVLTDFFRTVCKNPEKVTANDIRVYLYQYQKIHGISNRTLDCKRTIICSYFNWMASEEYIIRNPAVNIPKIKYERKHKRAMSQLDLEKIRSACQSVREKAIIEVLYSTGCRVTELERLNIQDVDFEKKEVYVFGKGDKHRTGYLNAKAEVALKNYLKTRTDDNPALFVYDRKPYGRLKKSGIEFVIRKIMERVTDVTTHVTPHVFRHTTATTALNRGMSVVEVSKILGHARLETTMEYIDVNMDSIKTKHHSFVN